EARRPFRRRNERPVIGDEIEQFEALSGRQRRRVVDERSILAGPASDFGEQTLERVARHDPLDAALDVFALTGELAAELGEQRGRALAIEGLERGARTS